jgi:hypothetical protein
MYIPERNCPVPSLRENLGLAKLRDVGWKESL